MSLIKEIGLFACLAVCILKLCATALADEVSTQDNIVFKVKGLEPSSDGVSYIATFTMENQGGNLVEIPISGKDRDGNFIPMFVQYEEFRSGAWKEVPIQYDGLSLQVLSLKPKEQYNLRIHLSGFEEQETPLRGRVGLGDIWSESFILDWSFDRWSGRFEQAKNANLDQVRESLLRVGFRKEMIEDNNFPGQLITAIIMAPQSEQKSPFEKPSRIGGTAGRLFGLKSEVSAEVTPNRMISFRFISDEGEKSHASYSGKLVVNPEGFSTEWFQKEILEKTRVTNTRGRITMEFGHEDIENDKNTKMYFCLYYKSNSSALISEEEARRVFGRMLNVISSWLKI